MLDATGDRVARKNDSTFSSFSLKFTGTKRESEAINEIPGWIGTAATNGQFLFSLNKIDPSSLVSSKFFFSLPSLITPAIRNFRCYDGTRASEIEKW